MKLVLPSSPSHFYKVERAYKFIKEMLTIKKKNLPILAHVMLKKCQLMFVQTKHWSGRVVGCLFLSTAEPKRRCSSHMIVFIGKETSHVWIFAVFSIRYDKRSLYGLALDKMNIALHDAKPGFFLDPTTLFCQFTLSLASSYLELPCCI